MKPADLRKETDEQLELSLKDTEKHLFQLRFQSATDRLETPSEIRKARKDIARIKTEQHARVLKIFNAQTDSELAGVLDAAVNDESAPGVKFKGRRKAVRVINRVTAMQARRAVVAAKATPSKA